jgi:DNA-3-methyladenine glycosylase II
MAKARALRGLAGKIASGELREEDLEPLPTPEAMRVLEAQPGIGPWTAGLILLRGLGRLDVFPGGDAGAARGLRSLLGDEDPAAALAALGPYRGMLYFHLLLARLRA